MKVKEWSLSSFKGPRVFALEPRRRRVLSLALSPPRSTGQRSARTQSEAVSSLFFWSKRTLMTCADGLEIYLVSTVREETKLCGEILEDILVQGEFVPDATLHCFYG